MKICVVGLGAVGGLMAVRLVEAGHEVNGVARGTTLEAVRGDGLRLRTDGGERRVDLPVSDDPATLGPADLLVIALKGPGLSAFAPRLAPLMHPATIVMPAMNGVPWWFLHTRTPAARLASVDPGARIETAVPLAQVIGCVVHLSASTPSPGVVQLGFGRRLIVGEPRGGESARSTALAAMLSQAGFAAESSGDIRREIWFKLWGNMTVNPVSALTGATCDRILDDPLVRAFMVRTMAEAAEIGARIGCPIDQTGKARLDVARQLGAFKTSMLQDLEAGRPIELDAIVTAVHDIARGLEIATPNIDALLGLSRLMGATRGIYATPDTKMD